MARRGVAVCRRDLFFCYSTVYCDGNRDCGASQSNFQYPVGNQPSNQSISNIGNRPHFSLRACGAVWGARLCDTYNFEASAQRLGLLMTIVRSKGLEPASSLCEISHLAEGSQSRPSVHRMAPATSSSRSRASRRSTHLRTRTAGPRARRARTRLTSPTSST